MSQLSNGWAFGPPPNLAVITVRQVVEGSLPILYVSHDADDGGWQFLTGLALEAGDVKVVSLAYIVKLDPSIAILAALPKGHMATRASVDDSWESRQQ